MTDLEHSLGPQLHRLADDLTPDADPLDQVTGARSRFRRRRRTRVGLAALAAATAAIVVGGPLAVGSVSSAPGDVAGPVPGTSTTTPTPGEDSRVVTQAEAEARLAEIRAARAAAAATDAATAGDAATAAEAAAAAQALAAAQAAAATQEAAAAEAARQQVTTEAGAAARLAEVAAQLDAPPILSAPVGAPLVCPSGTELAGALGGRPVLEQGGAAAATGCTWRNGTDGSGASASIGLDAGTLELYAGGDGVTSGCRVVEVAADVPLQRCVDAGEVTWNLYVRDAAAPDAAGISTSGTWRLTVTGRSGQPQLDPATTLAALADLAGATWGR